MFFEYFQTLIILHATLFIYFCALMIKYVLHTVLNMSIPFRKRIPERRDLKPASQPAIHLKKVIFFSSFDWRFFRSHWGESLMLKASKNTQGLCPQDLAVHWRRQDLKCYSRAQNSTFIKGQIVRTMQKRKSAIPTLINGCKSYRSTWLWMCFGNYLQLPRYVLWWLPWGNWKS